MPRVSSPPSPFRPLRRSVASSLFSSRYAHNVALRKNCTYQTNPFASPTSIPVLRAGGPRCLNVGSRFDHGATHVMGLPLGQKTIAPPQSSANLDHPTDCAEESFRGRSRALRNCQTRPRSVVSPPCSRTACRPRLGFRPARRHWHDAR